MNKLLLLYVFKCKHIFWKIIINQLPDLYPYLHGKKYGKRTFLGDPNSEEWIFNRIKNGDPLLISRFGAVELMIIRSFDANRTKNYKKMLEQAHTCAGIFPASLTVSREFSTIYQEASSLIDGIGIWRIEGEDYYINRLLPKESVCFPIHAVEAWRYEKPWTLALKGKKVLMIHPCAKTIEKQYKIKDTLFQGKEILPDFELITLEAVQTAAGAEDNRFTSWTEALEFMKEEISKLIFDIAILGCGAYGLPLAAYIKQMGKQAIHMGGVSQLLFGIKGGRWDNDSTVNCYYSDSWIYPSEEETPVNAMNVESAAYWGRTKGDEK